MSFRERASQPPEWDADEDAPPPVWQGHVDDRSLGARTAESADLPAWSFDLGTDDERAGVSYPQTPPRTRRTLSAATDRRGTAIPSLRDSLRGSNASHSTTGSRTIRRPISKPLTTNVEASVADYAPGDRLDDDRTWSGFDDPGEVPVDQHRFEEQRYPVRRANAERARPRPRRATPTRPRPQLQVPASVVALAAAQDRLILGAVGTSL